MTDTFTSNETVLKFQCEDRNYENWCILNNELLLKLTDDIHNTIFKDFDPIQHKLINQDIFTYDKEQNKVTLVHSSVRSMTTIGGILVLDGDKKYGKFKDKYLYRCVPDDSRLPIFTAPYIQKRGKSTFQKMLKNKYITFRFDNWNSKHPLCRIVQIIGNTSDVESFYEYQLYCKSLHSSIVQFTKDTKARLKDYNEKKLINDIQTKYHIQDDRSVRVISIDPPGCKDIDDAFSYDEYQNGSSTKCKLRIYIANVSLG